MPLHTRDSAALAAKAWDATKPKGDPDYDGCAPDHRSKLIASVEAIESTGYDDTAGLEAFGKKVRELLATEPTTSPAPKLLPAGKPPSKPAGKSKAVRKTVHKKKGKGK